MAKLTFFRSFCIQFGHRLEKNWFAYHISREPILTNLLQRIVVPSVGEIRAYVECRIHCMPSF